MLSMVCFLPWLSVRVGEERVGRKWGPEIDEGGKSEREEIGTDCG